MSRCYVFRKNANGLAFTEAQIKQIRATYINCRSVEKTAEIVGCSISTAHKYVRNLSSKDIHSIWKKNPVFKISPETGQIVARYDTPALASKLTGLSQSNINHCLAGRTKTAGGFIWVYENSYVPDKDYTLNGNEYFYSETAFIDRLLGLKVI